MIYAAGTALLTVVAGRTSSGSEDWVAQTVSGYADLDQDDKPLARGLVEAYIAASARPQKFQEAQSRVVSRIKQLRDSVTASGQGRTDLLRSVARLINLNELVKRVKVLPQQYLGRLSPLSPGVQPQVYAVDGTLSELPREFESLLDVEASQDLFPAKETFLAYVNRNVRRMVFVSQLKAEVKLISADKYNGTNEPATRTVLVDTVSEGQGRSYEPWELSGTIVHEAAHIAFAYRYADDPKMLDNNYSERFAEIVRLDYLGSLAKKADLSEATRYRISEAYDQIKARIENYNRRLGLAPNDYALLK